MTGQALGPTVAILFAAVMSVSAQVVTRVSEWPDGAVFQPEGPSSAISPDGRMVVLIGRELMLKTVDTGALDRILSLPDSPQSVRFSADNRYLMFLTRDGELPLRNFLLDVMSRQLQLIPRPAGITTTSGGMISADTRWLVYGAGGRLVLHDRIEDAITEIPGSMPLDSVFAISDDGSRVVMRRQSSPLERASLVVFDRVTGVVERVDVGMPTLDGLSLVFGARISGDGRYVAFDALCVLTPCDDPFRRLYIRDLNWRRTSQPIRGIDGLPPQFGVDLVSISRDGRHVLFTSGSRNLVAGVVFLNLFIVDRFTERIIQVNGGQGGSDFAAAMDGDGLRVAFAGIPIIPRGPGLTFSGYGPVFLSSVDVDGDGMQDDWERFVGLSPSDAGDGGTDDDHDGVSNLDEYRAGLQPRARFQFRTRGEIDPERARLVLQNRNAEPALVWLRLVDRKGLWAAHALEIPPRSTRALAFTDVPNRPREPFVLQLHADALVYPRLSQ